MAKKISCWIMVYTVLASLIFFTWHSCLFLTSQPTQDNNYNWLRKFNYTEINKFKELQRHKNNDYYSLSTTKIQKNLKYFSPSEVRQLNQTLLNNLLLSFKDEDEVVCLVGEWQKLVVRRLKKYDLYQKGTLIQAKLKTNTAGETIYLYCYSPANYEKVKHAIQNKLWRTDSDSQLALIAMQKNVNQLHLYAVVLNNNVPFSNLQTKQYLRSKYINIKEIQKLIY